MQKQLTKLLHLTKRQFVTQQRCFYSASVGYHVSTSQRWMQIYYRVHQRGFRVGHQNKDVSIQTKLVDPAVQLRRDVCPWAAGGRRV